MAQRNLAVLGCAKERFVVVVVVVAAVAVVIVAAVGSSPVEIFVAHQTAKIRLELAETQKSLSLT